MTLATRAASATFVIAEPAKEDSAVVLHKRISVRWTLWYRKMVDDPSAAEFGCYILCCKVDTEKVI